MNDAVPSLQDAMPLSHSYFAQALCEVYFIMFEGLMVNEVKNQARLNAL